MQCVQEQSRMSFLMRWVQLDYFLILLPLSACNRIPHKLCTGLCQAAILCTVCFSILCGKSDQTALVGGTAKELTPLPDIVSSYKVLVLESGVCSPVYPFSIFDRSR